MGSWQATEAVKVKWNDETVIVMSKCDSFLDERKL